MSRGPGDGRRARGRRERGRGGKRQKKAKKVAKVVCRTHIGKGRKLAAAGTTADGCDDTECITDSGERGRERAEITFSAKRPTPQLPSRQVGYHTTAREFG